MSKSKATYFKHNVNNDKILKDAIRGELEKQLRNGIAQGAYAICKVVLDMAKDESMDEMKRLNAVIEFCEKCAKPKQEHVAEEGNDDE